MCMADDTVVYLIRLVLVMFLALSEFLNMLGTFVFTRYSFWIALVRNLNSEIGEIRMPSKRIKKSNKPPTIPNKSKIP